MAFIIILRSDGESAHDDDKTSAHMFHEDFVRAFYWYYFFNLVFKRKKYKEHIFVECEALSTALLIKIEHKNVAWPSNTFNRLSGDCSIWLDSKTILNVKKAFLAWWRINVSIRKNLATIFMNEDRVRGKKPEMKRVLSSWQQLHRSVLARQDR